MNVGTAVTGGSHGTKWIGGVMAVAGVLSSVDPALLPPSWLPYVSMIGGLATIGRGFLNSSKEQDTLPPPQQRP